jgi:hypothetical protein
MSKAIVIDKTGTKMAVKETHYLLIVDGSSSMGHLSKSTISGVNEQIDTVKQLEKEFPDQKYTMSFLHFNNSVTIEYNDRSASLLEHITTSNYNCNGMTALLDAIGVGVTRLNDTIKDKIATGEASAVVVIITDGEENASREFDGGKVKSMIEELQKTERWTFTFVGANIDSISTARNYGINVSNVMQFSSDVESNAKVYKSMSKSFSMRASSIANDTYASMDFLSDEDKDATSK